LHVALPSFRPFHGFPEKRHAGCRRRIHISTAVGREKRDPCAHPRFVPIRARSHGRVRRSAGRVRSAAGGRHQTQAGLLISLSRRYRDPLSCPPSLSLSLSLSRPSCECRRMLNQSSTGSLGDRSHRTLNSDDRQHAAEFPRKEVPMEERSDLYEKGLGRVHGSRTSDARVLHGFPAVNPRAVAQRGQVADTEHRSARERARELFPDKERRETIPRRRRGRVRARAASSRNSGGRGVIDG